LSLFSKDKFLLPDAELLFISKLLLIVKFSIELVRVSLKLCLLIFNFFVLSGEIVSVVIVF